MRMLLASALTLGLMASSALAADEVARSKSDQERDQTGRFALTQAQMDELTAGVCIGNCPGGGNTQVGVNACVITRNCQPSNNNNPR